jgi:ABC-type glycerol-3-phosphate transport system permease component
MPIIPAVGRRNAKMRLFVGAMYAVLILGAVSVVYPFLLMLATSITSSPDTNEFRVVPRYLSDDGVLFAKFVDDKYAGDLDVVNGAYNTDYKKAIDVVLPRNLKDPGAAKLLERWREFRRTLPLDYLSCGFRGYSVNPSELVFEYRRFLRGHFKGDVDALNRSYVEENTTFDQVMPPSERPTARTWAPGDEPKMQDFQAWKSKLDPHWLIVLSVDGMYGQYLRDFENVPWREAAKAKLAAEPPRDSVERGRWERFVRTKLPLRYVRLSAGARDAYRRYLAGQYTDVAELNTVWRTSYRSFDQIALPVKLRPDSAETRVYGEFVAKVATLKTVSVSTPEVGFRQALLRECGSLQSVNDRFGLRLASIEELAPPVELEDATYVVNHASELRKSQVTRNYSQVLGYILLHGQSLWNTALFCLAAVLTALIVNPLCAYALARFDLPYAYGVLLFVLATMAFPAEVVMIPNFLLLKELGLLNTLAALVLPGIASGFSIFLLKGFFDSLPIELYEAGTIDGASELRMFFKVTIPMSKPIFAVIALGAFTAAYGAFMFALLVCQNPKMWTLMVWLYDLQGSAPQYVMMAGLTIAALPTLVVFAFAQKVIMRGIIIPMEK